MMRVAAATLVTVACFNFLPTTNSLAVQPFHEETSFSKLHTVALKKQYVPVRRGNRTVAYKTAYFGTVYIGTPVEQSFTVVFDTGSGHFILPSTTCESETCTVHHRYNRSLSGSAVDIDYDGTAVDSDVMDRDQVAVAFGTGEVSGEFVNELVCLGPSQGSEQDVDARPDCVKLRVVLASDMTPDPFQLFAFDGVAGLGLEALTLNPEFSFFGMMSKMNRLAQPCFGVFLARSDEVTSEIAFGGHDAARIDGPLLWTDVSHPDYGYWQVEVKSVRIGNDTISLCTTASPCYAILDTGTSLLGVPRQTVQHMHWLLARPVPPEQADVDCRTLKGPPVVFDLGNFSLQLDAEDYSRPASMRVHSSSTNRSQIFCRSSLLPVDMQEPLGSKVFIWGEPMLRKYYTAYNWRAKTIGFAPSVQRGSALPQAPPPSEVIAV